MLKMNSCIFKNNIPWRIIEEDAILIDVEHNSIAQLNEVAAFIWNKIDGKNNVNDIINCVYESFESDKDKIQKDTLEFLDKLLGKNFIKVK